MECFTGSLGLKLCYTGSLMTMLLLVRPQRLRDTGCSANSVAMFFSITGVLYFAYHPRDVRPSDS